jgi:beta-glucosidase
MHSSPSTNRPFVWGVATSAFQVEGAVAEDGRGESIWDQFCRVPGAIAGGANADVACDHFHRMEEDVALMSEIAPDAYRFSIAWSRILPEGRGRVEPRGLSFYDRLVDRLLERGIEPYATLYHWDLPQSLQKDGGWANRKIIEDYVRYSDVVTKALGDRVKNWITHNEPWCIALLGHAEGQHAPGLRDGAVALTVAHHVMVSHGAAIPVIRGNVSGARVGIALNLTPAYPENDGKEDREAAHAFDGDFNRWFLDPLFGRPYPVDRVSAYRRRGWLPPEGMPFMKSGDAVFLAEPCDFLGINYYTRARVAAGPSPDIFRVLPPLGEPTDMGWEVYPLGLYDIVRRVHREYCPAEIIITENGCSYADGPDQNEMIYDSRRIAYLSDHIDVCHRVMKEGVPLGGYFVWSLMDNFEWMLGYGQRFGLIWVDWATGRRVLKTSAGWLRDIIASQRTLKAAGSMS